MELLSCLILIFIIYSYLVGRILVRCFPQQLSKIKYCWPLGFFTILAMIQMVSFPLQYWHVPMSVVELVYHFIFFALTVFIIIELYYTIRDQRRIIRRFEMSQLIDYLLIAGFVIFNFAICYMTNSFNDTNSDQSFYITLVENNLNAAEINTILPVSGIISPLSALYNFQGFYLFLTYLVKIFSIDSILIMAWFVPFLLWITVAVTFLNIIYYFKLSYKWYLSIVTFLILWVFVDLFDYFVRYNCYGNNIRIFVFVYLMIFYCEYFKYSRVKTLILCSLLWLSAISLQSTSLFLGIFLMVAYGLYDLFIIRKRLLVPLVFSSFPLILYASVFLGDRGSWTPAYILCVILLSLIICSLFKRTRLIINQLIYSKGMQVLVIIGVILIVLLSIWMNPRLNPNNSISPTQMLQYLIEKYELQEGYLVPTKNWTKILLLGARRILLFINLYVLLHFKQLNKKLKFIVGTQAIMLLVFYNPLVCGFISTAFTGIVYTRIEDIVLSIFSISGLILYAVKSKNLKYLLLPLSLVSVLYLIAKTDNYLDNPYHEIKNIETYNHLYRMDQSLIDTAMALEEYIDKNITGERPKVLTTLHQLNYFASSYEMIYMVEHNRRLDDESYRQIYQDVYTLRDGIEKSYEVDEDVKQTFMSLVYNNNIDFIITSTDVDLWLKQELQINGECIFQNKDYNIYRIEY